jgi:hypothetical protein
VPAAPKISAQDEATILARNNAGEPLRAIAPDYGVSHQALSKRLRRARPPPAQQRQRQPQQAAEPAGGRAAVAVAAVSPSGRGLAEGLVRLRRGKEARWVDPLAESARYEQLLTEGFSA